MQDVLFKFGLCSLVVLDSVTSSKGLVVSMCDAPHLCYKFSTKRNHKAISAEQFNHFLNKAQNLATNNRATVGIFIESGITIVYNLIDWNHIIRSILAIKRKLQFLSNIELQGEFTFLSNNTNCTLQYLSLVRSDRSFDTSILQIIIVNRCGSHVEGINN